MTAWWGEASRRAAAWKAAILAAYWDNGHLARCDHLLGEAALLPLHPLAGRVALPRDHHSPTAAPLTIGRNKLRPSRMGSRHLGGATRTGIPPVEHTLGNPTTSNQKPKEP